LEEISAMGKEMAFEATGIAAALGAANFNS
jgi:hypothetical protein